MSNVDPCPFCGHKALVFSLATMTYCQCQNPDCAAHIGVPGKDKDTLVTYRWNRRNGA